MPLSLKALRGARRFSVAGCGKIQPDEQVMASSRCMSENSHVSSQQTLDTFLSDSIEIIRISLDYSNSYEF